MDSTVQDSTVTRGRNTSTVNHGTVVDSRVEVGKSENARLAVLNWNIDGLHSKISDGNCKSYIRDFDIAVLVETFVEKSYDLTQHFPDHHIYACSAVKLSNQGRRSGGIVVLVKKWLKPHTEVIETIHDQIVVLKLNKEVFNSQHEVIIIATYIPPQGSSYYDTAECSCHIENLDSCIIELMGRLKSFHLILLGDLNARTGRYQVDMVEDAVMLLADPLSSSALLSETRKSCDTEVNDFGKILLDLCLCFDLFIHNGAGDGDRDGQYTYISEHGNSVIDYCITSHEFSKRVHKITIAQRIESVHMPLEISLVLEHKNVPDEKDNFVCEKFVWQTDKAEQYKQEVFAEESVAAIRHAGEMVDIDIDEAVGTFCNCLLQAGQCMKKTIRAKQGTLYSEWFDPECKSSKKAASRALSKYRRTHADRDKATYLALRKQYKALIKKKETDFREERVRKLEQSANDPLVFWKEVKKCKRTTSVHGNIAKQTWFDHFSTLLNFGVDINNEVNQEEEIESEHFDEILDPEITEHEVVKALQRLKCGKAAGPDQIINEFLREARQLAIPFLVRLFNHIFTTGIFPKEWTKSIIVPLYKKGDPDNADNYRGISLLSCVSKVFTGVLNARLMKWADFNSVITDAQAGFRHGHSTVDHIFALYAIIEKQFAKNSKLYVAFVDFYKAFDTISHSVLWRVLSETGIRGKMLNVLKGMYASIKSCVRCTGGQLTEYFECLQGLKQGCLCSPILFSYFINELAKDIIRGGRHGIQLMPNHVELFLLLFADDLALMSSTVAGLQNQLNTLHESSQRMGLKVNVDKTKIVVFRQGGHLGAREVWHLGGDYIEVVGKYKYLGLNFSTMLSFNIATDEFVSRAKRGIVQIVRALKKYGCYSCEVFFKLFDSQIVPSLLYASELWGFKENPKIEKVNLYACKLFINVPSRTPNDMIYGDLGRYPLYIESIARCVQYWLRVLKQESTRYSKLAYSSLLAMHDRGHKNWVTHVKSVLCECGFGLVWLYGGVTNEKIFLQEFKERLKSNFGQRWLNHLQESNNFTTYHSFKSCVSREPYVDIIRVSVYRTALARFRMGVSPFYAHKYKFAYLDSSRMCPFCQDKVENEIHVVAECPVYDEIRERYLMLDMQSNNIQEQINQMLKTNDESVMVKLAKFLFLAWKARIAKFQQGE